MSREHYFPRIWQIRGPGAPKNLFTSMPELLAFLKLSTGHVNFQDWDVWQGTFDPNIHIMASQVLWEEPDDLWSLADE